LKPQVANLFVLDGLSYLVHNVNQC
jgi:hypothetical protein